RPSPRPPLLLDVASTAGVRRGRGKIGAASVDQPCIVRSGRVEEGLAVPTVYQRVLGAKFAELHPVLRRFHSSPRGGRQGRVRVPHFPGRLKKLLIPLMRLPAAGEDLPVELVVSPKGAGELWVRAFPGWRFVSIHTARGGLLFERDGPAT